MTSKNKPNELYLTRIYDAPVKMVWEAWTDPEQAAQWWGPRGFTITTHSKSLKPGGIWHYTMHGPDGTDYPNKTKYHEVVPLSRLVYDHGGNDEQAPLFRVTVEFTDLKGKTKMEMTMTLETEASAREMKKFIKQASGNSTWDRLAEYLEKDLSGKEKFVINRTFEAPLKTVYEMWTNPQHLTKWLGPTGSTMELLQGEIKAGASIFFSMTNESSGNEGVKLYGKIHYHEMQPSEHLTYTQQFADAQGNMGRHPMAPTWPAFMLTRVDFAEEAPNRTRVTVSWEPYGDVTSDELATFIQARSGMTQGWTGSFDKLEEYLTLFPNT